MERSVLKLKLEAIKNDIKNIEEVLSLEKTKDKINNLVKASLDASFWLDQNKAKKNIDETNDLKNKLSLYESLVKNYEELSFIYEMSETDEESLNLADDIITTFISNYSELENDLLLSEETDKLNAIVEIHSGAGGTESLDWTQMLYRMYQMYSQRKKFKTVVLDYQEGDEVGIKSVTFKVNGLYAYGLLKSESGIHRLVRLSPFDSSNRRHTTFASVSVTPEISDDIEVNLNESDLKIDVFHSSGAGGQSVNTTDSAVRITHLPSKIVVTCQNERSQIQNRATALSILKSKLYQIEMDKRKEEIDKFNNKMQIAFGSQIRSYTFHPYTLVKDHRTSFETSQGDKVMDGELDDFINAYLKERGKS